MSEDDDKDDDLTGAEVFAVMVNFFLYGVAAAAALVLLQIALLFFLSLITAD